jgi:ferredoxin-NADP reductase
MDKIYNALLLNGFKKTIFNRNCLSYRRIRSEKWYQVVKNDSSTRRACVASNHKYLQMSTHTVKILTIGHITRDALQIFTERPQGLDFKPGQAVDISINKEGWKNEIRPFTFTSLPDDDYLQFTIKTYPSHKGVTNELLQLRKNDELILGDVFGAIEYKGEGYFIAGGAGITPFISIFRYLRSKNATGGNKLIYANKTRDDIILNYEFHYFLGKNFINILSDEEAEGYAHGFITENFLKEHIMDFNRNFYLCGPPPMMDAVEKILSDLNVDEKLIIKEAV